jgi:replicative DNA helicase
VASTADLFLVAGRPSMGKSIIGMALGHHAAKLGEGVAVFSLEMTKESLVRRMISAVGMVDAQCLRTGTLDREERLRVAAAASQIEALPLWIDDTRARTVPAVTSALRKLIARRPVRLIIIDHLQLMKGVGRFENRNQELSEISHSLKHLAGQLDVTVILLSQLNRECEKAARRPQLSDLKETGSLEEDADIVLFIHRAEQFKRGDPGLRGQAEFIIGKQRSGPTGKQSMLFQHQYQRFVEMVGNSEAYSNFAGQELAA